MFHKISSIIRLKTKYQQGHQGGYYFLIKHNYDAFLALKNKNSSNISFK